MATDPMGAKTMNYLDHLQKITDALSNARQAEEIGNIILEAGMTALEAGGGAIALRLDEAPEILTWQGEEAAEYPLALNENSPLTGVIRNGDPLFIPDSDNLAVQYPRYSRRYAALSCLPLIVGERVIGAIEFVFSAPRYFDPLTQTYLALITHQCALALDRFWLFHQVDGLSIPPPQQSRGPRRQELQQELNEIRRRLLDGQEKERQLLALELHDGPVQDLYGVLYQLNELGESLLEENRQSQVATIQTRIEQTIERIRTISERLRPPALAPFGLEKAIRSLVDQIQASRPELTFRLSLDSDEQKLPEDIRLALFRICREALNNVIRHAEASQVEITFGLEEERAILKVADDGQGFEIPESWLSLVQAGHLGLAGIVERTAAIDGQLDIESAPGEGVSLQVQVTYPDMQEAR